jgi:hypothetical protein
MRKSRITVDTLARRKKPADPKAPTSLKTYIIFSAIPGLWH